MFHLAPVGLESRGRVRKEQHQELLSELRHAMRRCVQNGPDLVHNSREASARELLRQLDAFMSHG